MKTLICLFVLSASLSLTALNVQAQTAASAVGAGHEAHSHEKFDLPLTKGHAMFDINGAFANINDKESQSAYVGVGYEHFCFDHLSLGGGVTAIWDAFSKKTRLLISPSATYYFLAQEKWSPFVRQALSYNTDTADFGGTTSVGVAWFLNPHVAITPRLGYQYAISEREVNPFFQEPEELLNFSFGLSFYF